MKFKHKYVILLAVIIVVSSASALIANYYENRITGNTDSSYYAPLFNDPDVVKLRTRYIMCDRINSVISNELDCYKTKIYEVSELANPGLDIIDPLTGKANWELCDRDNPNTWYKTSPESYPGNLSLWIPMEHPSGIYKVRPQYTPEDMRIQKFMKSF